MAEPLDPQEIAGSARWLAQAYDPGSALVRFVAMEQEDYRAASFLDDRMFGQWRDVRTLPWAEVSQAMADKAGDARWIFHIGHVGSTLLARMLGDLPGVLSVREPRILRDLALLPHDRYAEMAPTVAALCSRTFTSGDSALVKATSFVSEIAPLLARPGDRVIFMYAGARSYMETILAGENSLKELEALRQFRQQRMAGRVPAMAVASLAHLAVMAWACEMTALEAAAEAMADRSILWLDFDRFLAEPGQTLFEAASHLDVDASREQASLIADGPLMRRYSKGPEYEYSPSLRQELQMDARRRHGADIDSALTMLDGAARQSTLLDRALGRASGRN